MRSNPPPDGRVRLRHQQSRLALGSWCLGAIWPLVAPADCPLAKGEMLFPNVSTALKNEEQNVSSNKHKRRTKPTFHPTKAL
eukprot:455676-Prymnesium_polylepis.1